jgi:hypothetical protein
VGDPVVEGKGKVGAENGDGRVSAAQGHGSLPV